MKNSLGDVIFLEIFVSSLLGEDELCVCVVRSVRCIAVRVIHNSSFSLNHRGV